MNPEIEIPSRAEATRLVRAAKRRRGHASDSTFSNVSGSGTVVPVARTPGALLQFLTQQAR